MKAIAWIAAGLLVMSTGCKRMDSDDVRDDETQETGLPDTRSDVSEIQGDTMSVEMATGMDTTQVSGAEVGAAAEN